MWKSCDHGQVICKITLLGVLESFSQTLNLQFFVSPFFSDLYALLAEKGGRKEKRNYWRVVQGSPFRGK